MTMAILLWQGGNYSILPILQFTSTWKHVYRNHHIIIVHTITNILGWPHLDVCIHQVLALLVVLDHSQPSLPLRPAPLSFAVRQHFKHSCTCNGQSHTSNLVNCPTISIHPCGQIANYCIWNPAYF